MDLRERLEMIRYELYMNLQQNLKDRNTDIDSFLKMYGESSSGLILYLIGQVRLLDYLLQVRGEEE